MNYMLFHHSSNVLVKLSASETSKGSWEELAWVFSICLRGHWDHSSSHPQTSIGLQSGYYGAGSKLELTMLCFLNTLILEQ